MSSKKLLIAFTISAFAIGLSSCKKTSTTDTTTNATATTELSQELAISDNITEDANNSVMVSADNQSLLGRPAGIESPDSISICATVSANIHNFPDTINVNFTGTPCNGLVTRSGSIRIILSGFLRANGTVATVSFNNYYVNGYNRQGTIVWTNTRSSTGDTLSWTRVDNGKVLAPSGKYWTCIGSRQVKQIAGNSTYTMWDDAFSLSGNLSVTNQANLTASAVTVSPLQKAVICPYIGQGQLQLTGPGGNALLIDYGNGACDANATYSLNGGVAVPFTLQ